MSSNNQLVILKKKDLFEIHENSCVDNSFKANKNSYLNSRKYFEEACKFAQKYQRENIVKYGIFIHPSCWSKKKIK